MDNDGHPDVIVGNAAQRNAVFFNRGGGKELVEVPFGDPSQTTYDLAVGDLDQDGDLDVAVANSDSRNLVYLNRSLER